jgi:hypothetical protein
VRKLISFDEETYQALTQLSRDRMGTLQELADEAFRDLLKKHNVPINLKDALKRSVANGHSETSRSKSQIGKRPTATMKRRALRVAHSREA